MTTTTMMMMKKKEEGHNHWWKRRCKQERHSHRAWEIPQKKNFQRERQETNFFGDLWQRAWVADFSCQRFWETKTPQNFLSEKERWRRQLLRRWGQFLVEICASEMADQNTGLEKNSGSQRSSLSPILSLVRIFPAENQNRGFEKAGGSEQESICFLFIPPEFRGKQKI